MPADKLIENKEREDEARKEEEKLNVVCFLIDSSGSMSSIKNETISFVNEHIQEVKKEMSDMNNRVLLVTFSGTPELVLDGDVNELEEFTEQSYTPMGYTALNDSIKYTADLADKIPSIDNDDTSVLFIIVTDGDENASRKVSQPEVAELIQEKQKTGRWTFTYMAANQDLSKIQALYNIPNGNIAAFTADSGGVRHATMRSRGGLRSYAQSRRIGAQQVANYYVDNSSSDGPEFTSSDNSNDN